MRWLTRWRLRLRSLVQRKRVDEELDSELQFYLDHVTETHLSAGASKADAVAAARRSMGSIIKIKEAVRETRGLSALDHLLQDCRFSVRSLIRDRAFSFVVILIIALGIGLNTAVFSLVHSVLLRQLPVTRPQELVLMAASPAPGTFSATWNYRVWDEVRRQDLFAGSTAYQTTHFNLAAGGERDIVDGLRVSGSFFDTLGVTPRLGRTLTTIDDQRGGGPAGPAAVISYRLWHGRFGGSADIIGRTLSVGQIRYSIVGVLPEMFHGPVVGRVSDVVVPLEFAPRTFLENPGIGWLTIMARLKPSDTAERATTALRQAQAEIRHGANVPGRETAFSEALKHPLTLLPAAAGTPLSPLRVQAERPLWTLLIIVGILLMIACGNVANLMLARALAREREMSLRAALGGSRRRLMCGLFIESSVLATAGGAAGLILATWVTNAMGQFWSTDPEAMVLDLNPDRSVLLFSLAATIATVVLSGTLPALRGSRIEPIQALNNRARAAVGARANLASWLVSTQVAASLTLVLGAGLFARTFANLTALDLGFDPRGVLVADVSLGGAAIPPVARLSTFEDIRRAVERIPGIEGVAMADLTPVTDDAMVGEVSVSGGDGDRGETFFNRVSPGWLAVYKVSLLAGRDFTDEDRPGTKRVCLVNEAFSRKFLNGANPIGQVVRNSATEMEIVGLVGDAVYNSLRGPIPPTLYSQFFQLEPELAAGAAPTEAALSIRGSTTSLPMMRKSVSAAIERVNPRLAFSFQPLPAIVSRSILLEKVLAIGSVMFGAIAMLLAAVGLYGVTAYAVRRRRQEIGIRMALGAEPKRIVRLVFQRVSYLVLPGIVVGAAASLWLSRLVAPLLYELEPHDLTTLLSAVAALVVAAAIAGWLPAHHASTLDPAEVLRSH
jgi:putative ABC transport system permease protein